jgi:hypothetical protein
MTAAVHSNTPVINSVLCYYLTTEEGVALCPEGAPVLLWQAYDVLTGEPIGPQGGDVNPAFIRLWVQEQFPAAIEAQIVSVWA